MNRNILMATIVSQIITVSSYAKSFIQEQSSLDLNSPQAIEAVEQKLNLLKNKLDRMSESVMSEKGIKILQTELETSNNRVISEYLQFLNVTYRVDVQGANGVVQLHSAETKIMLEVQKKLIAIPGKDAVYNDLGELVEESIPATESVSYVLRVDPPLSDQAILALGILSNVKTNKEVSNLFLEYAGDFEVIKKADLLFEKEVQKAREFNGRFDLDLPNVRYGKKEFTVQFAYKLSEVEKNMDLFRSWNRAGSRVWELTGLLQELIPLNP